MKHAGLMVGIRILSSHQSLKLSLTESRFIFTGNP